MLLTFVSGCSPMYQSVYEGDVRFEHCYRVDEERQLPITDKLQCWRDWNHRFRYGQSRDRISYGEARERTLAQALAAGQQAAPRGAGGETKLALPLPKSVYAPPPATLSPASLESAGAIDALRVAHDTTGTDAGTAEHVASLAASNTEPRAALADAPGASCAGACAKTWSTCKQPCKAGACRTACDEHYRGCMKACF